MRFAVIIAGGSGTRLWPLSRRARPKQMLRLFEGKSLLRHSFERLAAFLPAESICVITLAEHLGQVRTELPEVPEQNLFGEPCGRDTAAAVGLAAAILHRRDAEGVMGVFTADHLITPVERFLAAVEAGFAYAERRPEALVTFGIPPASPHTGYGYLRRGSAMGGGIWAVEAFVEKPDRATAERYLTSQEYYWNSGMFVWRTTTILKEMRRLIPAHAEALAKIADAWNTPGRDEVAGAIYPNLPRTSVDYAVMEKAGHVCMTEMDCRWLDVGSWTALPAAVPADADGNVSAGARMIQLRSCGNIVVADDPEHLVATVGVEGLVIVRSADATLVCRREDAQAVRELVARVRAQYGDRYD